MKMILLQFLFVLVNLVIGSPNMTAFEELMIKYNCTNETELFLDCSDRGIEILPKDI